VNLTVGTIIVLTGLVIGLGLALANQIGSDNTTAEEGCLTWTVVAFYPNTLFTREQPYHPGGEMRFCFENGKLSPLGGPKAPPDSEIEWVNWPGPWADNMGEWVVMYPADVLEELREKENMDSP